MAAPAPEVKAPGTISLPVPEQPGAFSRGRQSVVSTPGTAVEEGMPSPRRGLFSLGKKSPLSFSPTRHMCSTPTRHIASSWRIRGGKKLEVDPLLANSDYFDEARSDTVYVDEEVTISDIRRRRRGRHWLVCSIVCGIALLIVLLVLNALLFVSSRAWGHDDDPDSIFSAWGKPGTGTEGLAWYPTDFLRDVQPIPCHSHNDYWRKVPLFSALHAGCIGVEVFYNESRRGVFDVDPAQTLALLVDVKTDGASTWREVVRELEPLRSRGWLSRFDYGKVTYGPITVVGTGNTPFDVLVANSTYRDYFFDAPLDKLGDEKGSKYDSTNSYYASVSLGKSIGSAWLGELNPGQQHKLHEQIEAAHKKGLKARYWDLPAWPVHVRNGVWSSLVKAGVDLLNVDDLRSASKKDWTKVWPF
ncbi:hypothetical protein MAPG_04399 [Magnaporthiopsis poae ATCC 64411]|uniref:Altered inheritance of mitochondria protein 6 n=1 Tax=Magnaporthiopsis poae (strain ATCC 64411 / 73-15) TaxID=644358 RepID=A0A0C4DWM0_MAGP6|nr:hypothetical protein MAPG_04399 [Magnaporthiopsis poae ATCC 64411]